MSKNVRRASGAQTKDRKEKRTALSGSSDKTKTAEKNVMASRSSVRKTKPSAKSVSSKAAEMNQRTKTQTKKSASRTKQQSTPVATVVHGGTHQTVKIPKMQGIPLSHPAGKQKKNPKIVQEQSQRESAVSKQPDGSVLIRGVVNGQRTPSRILEEQVQQIIQEGARSITIVANGQHGIGGRIWPREEKVFITIEGTKIGRAHV